LLLNSYFKHDVAGLVNSMQEVIHGKYSLSSMDSSIKALLKNSVINQDEMKILKRKKDDYQARFKFDFNISGSLLNKLIFNDIASGKAVLLGHGYLMEGFSMMYSYESDRFLVADNKYVKQFVSHLVHRKSALFTKLNFAYVEQKLAKTQFGIPFHQVH